MQRSKRFGRWLPAAGMGLAAACVLGLCQSASVAQQRAVEPFANAVEQRIEIINQLKEIKELLKEQNAMLRSGGKLEVGAGEQQGRAR